MQVIDCDNAIAVTVRIGGQEYGLREFTMDDQSFLEGLSDGDSVEGLKSVLIRCGLPESEIGKIPLTKIKDIADALSGQMAAKKK